jgi:hypothetical protein
LAVILAVVDASTALVEIKKLAEVSPPATVTVEGTHAEFELLLSLTRIPSPGAAEPRVTVPVTTEAPVAEVEPRVSIVNVGGSKVKEAILVLLPSLASMPADVMTATGAVDTVNVADVEPDGTVTDPGTVAPE